MQPFFLIWAARCHHPQKYTVKNSHRDLLQAFWWKNNRWMHFIDTEKTRCFLNLMIQMHSAPSVFYRKAGCTKEFLAAVSYNLLKMKTAPLLDLGNEFWGKREWERGKKKKKRGRWRQNKRKKKVHLKLIKPHFLPLHQKSLLFRWWIHFQRHADPFEGNSGSYSCAICPAVYALLAHLLSAKHHELPRAEAVPVSLCFILVTDLQQRQCPARYIPR